MSLFFTIFFVFFFLMFFFTINSNPTASLSLFSTVIKFRQSYIFNLPFRYVVDNVSAARSGKTFHTVHSFDGVVPAMPAPPGEISANQSSFQPLDLVQVSCG